MASVMEIVDLDSDEKSDDESHKPVLKRTARKSTAPAPPPRAEPVKQQTSAVTTRRQVALATAAKKTSGGGDRFMENFDPDSSVRERRKLTRKFNAISINTRKVPGAVYDEFGMHIASGIDLCDCLNKACSGCHLPCAKCQSQKCGPECRNNRKYIYDQIEFHGCDVVVKNPILNN